MWGSQDGSGVPGVDLGSLSWIWGPWDGFGIPGLVLGSPGGFGIPRMNLTSPGRIWGSLGWIWDPWGGFGVLRMDLGGSPPTWGFPQGLEQESPPPHKNGESGIWGIPRYFWGGPKVLWGLRDFGGGPGILGFGVEKADPGSFPMVEKKRNFGTQIGVFGVNYWGEAPPPGPGEPQSVTKVSPRGGPQSHPPPVSPWCDPLDPSAVTGSLP